MFKALVSFFSAFLVSCSFVLAAPQAGPPMGPPPRPDRLDWTSPQAKMELKRAENILSTLVHDPQSYQLILSDKTTFGGEAWPPYVWSDKPTMIIYQGSLAPNRSNEEIAFMMAHELGHLNLYHNEKMAQEMDKVMLGPPIGLIGTLYNVFYKKLQEREADMFGLYMYKRAGYDIAFFPQTLELIKINPSLHTGDNRKILSSMSLKDTHFSMKERFELLTAKSKEPIT